MKGTVLQLGVEDSLRAREAGQGSAEGSRHEGVRGRAGLVANRFPPPVSSPTESGGGCWPAGPSGVGWVQLAAGSFVACPDTSPAPAASAEDMASPGKGPHMCSAYVSPPCPICTYRQEQRKVRKNWTGTLADLPCSEIKQRIKEHDNYLYFKLHLTI